jgi:hypothetical protein
MKIELLAGDDCFRAIDNNDFIESWKRLAHCSEYFTLNQEYNFVASWYLSYRERYNPIMIIGYDDNENMLALMPLALSYESGTLSHAGDNQAEYNSWVCQAEYYEEFIIEALIKIKNTLDITTWEWTWLPYDSDRSWLYSKRLRQEGIYFILKHFDSPIYNLENSDRINKIKKNKSVKSKINRLNRQGELRMERITDNQVAERLIERIIKQSSFRNIALYNQMPFVNDKNRRDWHLRRIAMPNNNEHYTVLWQGDELLACNFGSCSDDTVVIGTFTYDPIQGGNSPGKIFIIKLIEFLAEEGYQYLDLSPGGDSYKEGFCNAHNDLVRPTICFSHYKHIKTKIISSSRKRIRQKLNGRLTNRDMASISSLREKRVSSVIKRELLNLYNNKGNNKDNLLIHKKEFSNFYAANNIAKININKYEDLLLYKNTNGYLTRKEVTFDALKKFERGDVLYTMAFKDVLVGFIWLARSGKKHWHSCLVDRINNEKHSVFLYDLYVSRKYNANLIFKLLFSHILKSIKADHISSLYFVKSLDVNIDTLKQVGFEEFISTTKEEK